MSKILTKDNPMVSVAETFFRVTSDGEYAMKKYNNLGGARYYNGNKEARMLVGRNFFSFGAEFGDRAG